MASTNTRKRLTLEDVRTQVGEAAVQAKEIIVPFAIDAKDRIVPLAEAAVEKARPLALDAKERLAPLAEAAISKARPAVSQARSKVVEVVETEVVPRLTDLREQAEPLVDHGQLVVAALKGEDAAPVLAAPVVAVVKKRHHPILKTLGLAMLVAVVGIIVKLLLESREDGWELQDDEDGTGFEPVTDLAEPAPAGTVAEEAAPANYGEGSYRGDNPPAGFDIKGNERSMKFHVPTALGFERTVTDLWFDSPESAERAGFTRALR